MLENFQSVSLFSPTFTEIMFNLFVSLVCSFIASLIYRWTYKGPGYSDNFVHSIIYLSMITSLVIMVIGNNLARAFGLVGALSIIRFRTAIKDTVDIVFIFFGLAIGMAAGVGYHRLAFVGTIIISAVLILFSKTNYKHFLTNQYILQFSFAGENKESDDFANVLSRHCKNFETINIRSNDVENVVEYSFYIRIKKDFDSRKLIDELRQVKGVQKINLFFDQQNS